jgi:hypothetical protein
LVKHPEKWKIYGGFSQFCAKRGSLSEQNRGIKKGHPKVTFFAEMVGRTGFEPVTNWLKANCSTN